MKTISVSEFKKTCTRVLRKLPLNGEPILITSRRKVVAKIVPTMQKGKQELPRIALPEHGWKNTIRSYTSW